jgi:hypothetical protein
MLRAMCIAGLLQSAGRAMAEYMSPLLTLRRFEAMAHDVLPRPLDTTVMVASVAISLGTKMIGSSNSIASGAAISLDFIVALALAARVGREATQRRCGKNFFGTSVFALSRFVYLGFATLAVIMSVLVAMMRFLKMLGV